MKYITGIHALNLPCKLDTTGDWHTSAIQWREISLQESQNSIFKDYGIEINKKIPEHEGMYNVANHIRAILDILYEEKFNLITNFNNDFICNDKYTEEIFNQVLKLLPNNNINDFMHKTYGKEWRIWIGEHNMAKL